MLKLMIVDDEYLVRVGLRETIDWASIGFEVVAEATNGREALEKIHQLHPDIVISDVKMPIMDGVQLVAALQDEHFDGKVLILSGYNDFHYAKTSFENGLFRYLLKPLDNAELIAAVVEAGEKLVAERKERAFIASARDDLPTIKEKLASDLLHGIALAEVQNKFTAYGIEPIERGVVIFCRKEFVEATPNAEMRMQLAQLLDGIESQIAPRNTLRYFEGNHAVLIVEGEDLDEIERQLVKFINEKDSGAPTSVGVSDVFSGLSAIAEAYSVAKFVATNKLYVSLSTVSTKRDAENPLYKKHVIEALKYVAEHFSDTDLNVREVAEHLNVSESYLMHMFKDNLNKTFNTCLTEFRIMKAKALLLTEKYRINEIAEMVGYCDVKYFSQVFKRIVGMTPSEYVKSKNEKNNIN